MRGCDPNAAPILAAVDSEPGKVAVFAWTWGECPTHAAWATRPAPRVGCVTGASRLTRRGLAAAAMLTPGFTAAEQLEVPPGMLEQGAPVDTSPYGLPAATEKAVHRRSRPG